jgi:hypothetical protein
MTELIAGRAERREVRRAGLRKEASLQCPGHRGMHALPLYDVQPVKEHKIS